MTSEPTFPGQDVSADRGREFDNFDSYGETLIFAFDSRYRPNLSNAAIEELVSAMAPLMVGGRPDHGPAGSGSPSSLPGGATSPDAT